MTASTEEPLLATYPEANTLRMERVLTGPIERVWQYLTDAELRGKWLAAGPMELRAGGRVEMTWANDTLSPLPDEVPEKQVGARSSMQGTVVACDPPRMIRYEWQIGVDATEVTFELSPAGENVLLRLTHRRVTVPATLQGVSIGWQSHLDVLADVLEGKTPRPFWKNFTALKERYTVLLAGK
ncbi:MAG TPA: SRPBCC family protein [Gemmatimonadales bacterium]|jgi:uncharacterized protein YndB with AHSA1/START domain